MGKILTFPTGAKIYLPKHFIYTLKGALVKFFLTIISCYMVCRNLTQSLTSSSCIQRSPHKGLPGIFWLFQQQLQLPILLTQCIIHILQVRLLMLQTEMHSFRTQISSWFSYLKPSRPLSTFRSLYPVVT